jgi:hypothetical protein
MLLLSKFQCIYNRVAAERIESRYVGLESRLSDLSCELRIGYRHEMRNKTAHVFSFGGDLMLTEGRVKIREGV